MMNHKWRFMSLNKLREIIDSHHHTGSTGKDYAVYIEELRDIYYWKLSRLKDNTANSFEQYEDYLDSEGVPPVPLEALEA